MYNNIPKNKKQPPKISEKKNNKKQLKNEIRSPKGSKFKQRQLVKQSQPVTAKKNVSKY